MSDNQDYNKYFKLFIGDDHNEVKKSVEEPFIKMIYTDNGQRDTFDSYKGFKDMDNNLKKFRNHHIIKGIIDDGYDLSRYAKEIDEKLTEVEFESIQDYIHENDNLIFLHNQVNYFFSISKTLDFNVKASF